MPARNISYAQNGEDIVLWRALGAIADGNYIDVGANHPSLFSVTKKFYDAGWRGIAIEPNPEYASMFARERPRDTVIEAVISHESAESVPFHLIEGTGLSTLVDDISETHRNAGFTVRDIEVPSFTLNEAIERAGYANRDIHFMVVDTEGAEPDVLASIDFTRYRPWVLLIEATEPLSTRQVHEKWEHLVLEAGYRFCLFDGLSRIYVAEEHAEELESALTYSAGILDDFVTIDMYDLQESVGSLRAERDQLRVECDSLRGQLDVLREEANGAHAAVRALQTEVEKIQSTLSWRITKPLRGFRKLGR